MESITALGELKKLVEFINGLPHLGVWILVGYLVYQLAVVGSIFGVIRLSIIKLHDAVVNYPLNRKRAEVDITGTINGMCITSDGAHTALIGQILRVRGKATNINSQYIHLCSVEWLREAIDAKERADFDKEAVRKKSTQKKEDHAAEATS